jgi:serralysin
MIRTLRSCVMAILLVVTSTAFASFHLFRLEQIYSNADGTVQFVVLHESTGSNGENLWVGQRLTSSDGYTTKVFTFPSNLPSATTAGRRVLIATAGFAALGLVTPDFVVPNGFLWAARSISRGSTR